MDITSHTPAPHLPTHHTWVFDTQSGIAHISDDHDKPRRNRGHHDELAEKVGQHPDRIHGFAYRIHGGWRITDWDHKSVDPYVVKQVVSALNHKES